MEEKRRYEGERAKRLWARSPTAAPAPLLFTAHPDYPPPRAGHAVMSIEEVLNFHEYFFLQIISSFIHNIVRIFVPYILPRDENSNSK